MRDVAFLTTGDPEQDAKIAQEFDLHTARMEQNVCPNGCTQMVWDGPHNRHCPACGFAGFSTKPFDMKTAEA